MTPLSPSMPAMMSGDHSNQPGASEIRASKTALFVIDIQNELATDPETRIPHAERVKQAAAEILASARHRRDPTAADDGNNNDSNFSCVPDIIVFVQHEDAGLTRGSDPWKLVFEPKREDGEKEILVHKTTRDTFESNPDLAAELQRRGVGHIVACGIQSECCVESTCNGALDAGFVVTLLRGAHSTYDDVGSGSGIGKKSAVDIEREVEKRLEDKGVRMLDWEEVIRSWDCEL